LKEIWSVVSWGVDLGAHLSHGEELSRVGDEECLDIFQGDACIEPTGFITRMEYNRHAVVDLGHERVCLHRDDGKRGVGLAQRIVYRAPKTRKGTGLSMLQSHTVGDFALACVLPLVKAIG
jgi:hypothetical protein